MVVVHNASISIDLIGILMSHSSPGRHVSVKKDEGYGLSESIELKSATTNCVHDGRVVNDLFAIVNDCDRSIELTIEETKSNLDCDAFLFGSDYEIGMCGGSKGVSHDQKGDVLVLGLVEHLIAVVLYKLAIGDGDRLAVERFELLLVHSQERRVCFEIDRRGTLHGLESLHRDVLLVAETQSYKPKNHPFFLLMLDAVVRSDVLCLL